MNNTTLNIPLFVFCLILFASPVSHAQCTTDALPGADELHITGMIHFNINVRDYPRSREFYRAAGFIDQIGPFPETNSIEVAQGVGLDKLYRLYAELIYLGQLPDEPLDLTVPTGRFIDLIDWLDPERLSPPYSAINHMGLSYFTLTTSNIDAQIEGLILAGATMVAGPVADKNGDRSAMLRDPDGTFLKLLQPSVERDNTPSIEHININVSDLDCSQRFYEMLGLEVLNSPTVTLNRAKPLQTGFSQRLLGQASAAPQPAVVNDPLTAALGLGSEVIKHDLVMRHRTDGAQIQLSQWVKPNAIGTPYAGAATHIGINRINWASSDLESDVALMKSRGIQFLSPIAPCCEGKASTFGFIMFKDPDGVYNQIMGTISPLED